MIRACACGAKLFAALGYEQPGAYAPPARVFSSPPTKKPPGRQDGGRRGDDQGLRLRRKTRFASTNSRGAYAPPVRLFSSPPTKKPPERRGGGRRGDDQGLRLRRKTLRCARVRTAGALRPAGPRLQFSANKKTARKAAFLLVELKAAKTHTVLYQINKTEYYCQVDLPLSDYPLYGKQLVASRG